MPNLKLLYFFFRKLDAEGVQKPSIPHGMTGTECCPLSWDFSHLRSINSVVDKAWWKHIKAPFSMHEE